MMPSPGRKALVPFFCRNFIGLLRVRAVERPAKNHLSVTGGEAEGGDLSCRGLAVRLKVSLLPGDRALRLPPPSQNFVASFLGCLCAGAIAVPVCPALCGVGWR